jgi:hypothetical protein
VTVSATGTAATDAIETAFNVYVGVNSGVLILYILQSDGEFCHADCSDFDWRVLR